MLGGSDQYSYKSISIPTVIIKMQCQQTKQSDSCQGGQKMEPVQEERITFDAGKPCQIDELADNQKNFGQVSQIQVIRHKNVVSNKCLLQAGNRCIKGDAYYRLFAYLHDWMYKQCIRFNHHRETYANAVCLMDRYYRQKPLEKDNFMPIVLCLMAISSKALDRKVIFISTLAKKNDLDLGQTLQVQRKLLFHFGFKINSYNFVRVMGHYMKLWDEEVLKGNGDDWLHLLFLRDGIENYILFEEMFFLCDSHLKHRRSLSQQRIKSILKFVVLERCRPEARVQILSMIEGIFQNRMYTVQQEQFFSYENDERSDQGTLRPSLVIWRSQFTSKQAALRERYLKNSAQYPFYGQFLSILT